MVTPTPQGQLTSVSLPLTPLPGGLWPLAISFTTLQAQLYFLENAYLGFPCGSAGKESVCKAGDLGSIPGLGRSPGRRERLLYSLQYSGFPDSLVGKESTCSAGDPSSIPVLGRATGGRDRLPSPVFLGFPCGSAGKESTCNVEDLGSTPRLGRTPGEAKGYPLPYSGLENSMDCAWVIKSQILSLSTAPWKESNDKPRRHIKKQRHYFANKGLSSQGYGFSIGHVRM